MENLRITEPDDYLQNSESLISEEEIKDFEVSQEINGESSEVADAQTVLNELTKLFNSEKERLIDSLTYYAQSNIYYYTGKSTLNNMDATEFVSLAIENILELDRKWYPRRVHKFKSLLYLVILSEIRNQKKLLELRNDSFYSIEHETNPKVIKKYEEQKNKKKRNTRLNLIPLTRVNHNGEEFENSIGDIQAYKDYVNEKESLLESAEEIGEYFDRICDELEGKGDVDAALVLMERLKTKSNKDTAKNLGMELTKVEAAIKRIKRLAYNRRHDKING